MDKQSFIDLLHKYRLGIATEEECEFLTSYYKLFDREPDVLSLMTAEHQVILKDVIKNGIWENIEVREQGNNARSARRMWIRRYSAAAILAIVLSGGLYFFNTYPVREAVSLVSGTGPGKTHRLIRLADGSTVIVSAGSKLNYPSSFDGSIKREVYLEGAAYFDINPNPQKPFIIHTGKIRTTVLGTAFEIKAWPLDANITVTVSRGKVKVDAEKDELGILRPNQQLIYMKDEGRSIRRSVDALSHISWKDQDLLMNDITVQEASELLEDRFKVQVLFSDEVIRTKRFTTTLLKKETLEQVLTGICEFNGALYQYNKEKALVIISSAD